MEEYLQGESHQSPVRVCDVKVEYAIAAGEYDAALSHLVQGYQGTLLSYCRKQLGHVGAGGHAEDVAQEVFLTAFQLMPRKGPAPIRPWLLDLAKKRCQRAWRDAGRRARLMETQRGPIADTTHRARPALPEEHLWAETELAWLRASLAKLSKREQELLDKHFFRGCAISRLARHFFCSETTVRNRLTKTLERLLQIYKRVTKET